MANEQKSGSKTRKLVISVGVGAAIGLVTTRILGGVIESGALGSIGLSREIAATIGLLYVIVGLMAGVGVISPKVGAKFLNVEDPEELMEQRKILFYSTISMVPLGAALMLLAFAQPLGPVPAGVALAVLVAALIGSWWAGNRQLKLMDEMMQQVSRETAATAFYLVMTIGGGWATAAHLEYVPGPAMLDWMTMFASFLLIAAFWSTGKRGLLKPR
ncbi:hypothetical protein [Erythrobacter sp. EC-HK427]|uniref:hypothetical protein n=1 Tax=Erythrobacter sp. EC-HK427 TaxID=2038396 RepID=UPI00125F2485|nr:hypothetical protein [Erythrobacter sp. EC-HK427]